MSEEDNLNDERSTIQQQYNLILDSRRMLSRLSPEAHRYQNKLERLNAASRNVYATYQQRTAFDNAAQADFLVDRESGSPGNSGGPVAGGGTENSGPPPASPPSGNSQKSYIEEVLIEIYLLTLPIVEAFIDYISNNF